MRCGARSADFSLVRQGDTTDIGAYRQQLLLQPWIARLRISRQRLTVIKVLSADRASSAVANHTRVRCA